jgi:hypothetical protein
LWDVFVINSVEQLQTLPKTQSEIDISPFLKTQKPSILYSIIHRYLWTKPSPLFLEQRPTCLEIGLFLLCIYYSPWKHTSIFIYSSWQLSMGHFPLAICDFQTTFLKIRIKATEVSILATSAGHFKYWRYGKTREFRVKSSGIFGAKFNFTRNSRVLPYRQYFKPRYLNTN